MGKTTAAQKIFKNLVILLCFDLRIFTLLPASSPFSTVHSHGFFPPLSFYLTTRLLRNGGLDRHPCRKCDWKVGRMSWRLTQITITRSSWRCKLNSTPLSRCKSREPREQPYVQPKHTSEQVPLFAGSWDGNLTFQSTEEERFVSCQWADDMSSWQWFKMHQTFPETFSQLFICLDNFQLFCPTSPFSLPLLELREKIQSKKT